MEKLTLSNMGMIDNGLLEAVFDQHLTALVKDCDERPLEDKARELTLKIKLTPKPEMSGRGVFFESAEVEFEITAKSPVARTKLYTMKPKQDGSLAFQPESPEDPDQLALAQEVERKREASERRERRRGE